ATPCRSRSTACAASTSREARSEVANYADPNPPDSPDTPRKSPRQTSDSPDYPIWPRPGPFALTELRPYFRGCFRHRGQLAEARFARQVLHAAIGRQYQSLGVHKPERALD